MTNRPLLFLLFTALMSGCGELSIIEFSECRTETLNELHFEEASALGFSAQDVLLAAGSLHGPVVWDPTAGELSNPLELQATFIVPPGATIRHVRRSPADGLSDCESSFSPGWFEGESLQFTVGSLLESPDGLFRASGLATWNVDAAGTWQRTGVASGEMAVIERTAEMQSRADSFADAFGFDDDEWDDEVTVIGTLDSLGVYYSARGENRAEQAAAGLADGVFSPVEATTGSLFE